ncbi:MAG: hypothetical protein U1F34_03215 [Gammaproteobacteria bacterium]
MTTDSASLVAVLQLINAYRFQSPRTLISIAHQYERPEVPELDKRFHGLAPEDMDSVFNTGSYSVPREPACATSLRS